MLQRCQSFSVFVLLFVAGLFALPAHAFATISFISLDGHASNAFSATNSGTVTLTTSQAYDVIVLHVFNESSNNPLATVSSVSGGGLTWLLHFATTSTNLISWDQSNVPTDMEVWYATTTSVLSGTVITVTLTGTTDDASIVAFGVHGAASLITPWDTNASLPAQTFQVGSACSTPGCSTPTAIPSVSGVSTNNAYVMMLGILGSSESGTDLAGTNFTADSGYTKIDENNNQGANNQSTTASEYKIVSAAQSNATVAFGNAGSNWVMLADAIQGATQSNCATLVPGVNFITDTSKECITVPSDWSSSANSIEVIGGGGGGGGGSDSNNGRGGGGGEYRKITGVALTPGTNIPILIGSGGSGGGAGTSCLSGQDGANTTFNTVSLVAGGGKGAGSCASGGSGGTGGSGGSVHFNGGGGGDGGGGFYGADGGGGSGGPQGTGGAGGALTSAQGGAGGGGNGGGSAGTANPSGNSGTDGGNNAAGSGAGGGGIESASAGAPGTVGGGGGGGGRNNNSGQNGFDGGAGGTGTEWTPTKGSGGGGGGAGAASNGTATGGNGGAGALYGGGGGGGASGNGGAGGGAGGNGANGIIVVTYTPQPVTRIYLTSGTSWTVPSDWNSGNNSVELIGGGGSGVSMASASAPGPGGGGGAYAASADVPLTPGTTVTVQIGQGGAYNAGGGGNSGTDTIFNSSATVCGTVFSPALCAQGGQLSAGGGAAGAGGDSNISVGQTTLSGGAGGSSSGGTAPAPGGGGGAAGPKGVGGNGGNGVGNNFTVGGGGGGGNGGGTAGLDGPTGGVGGAQGGNNAQGSGGGTGGTGNGGNGSAGTVGGGGGGGGNPDFSVDDAGLGAAGGTGNEWDSTHGSGGGGGAAGTAQGDGTFIHGVGGNGALYGGGGGAGNHGGNGANGIIVITYTPAGRVIRLTGHVRLIGGVRLGGTSPLPHYAALAINGTPIKGLQTGGSSITTGTFTTTVTNAVILLVTETDAATAVSTVTATGLTFHLYKSFPNSHGTTEVWSALAASTFSNTIAINYAATIDDEAYVVSAVSGADVSNSASTPESWWDTNVSLPATAVSDPGAGIPTVSGVSTTNANTMLLGFSGSSADSAGNTDPPQTAGTGFTMFDSKANNGGSGAAAAASEYKIVSSAQTSQTVAFGSSYNENWMMIAAAIKAALVH